MSSISEAGPVSGGLPAVRWLALAATPCFGLMAAFALWRDGAGGTLCPAMPHDWLGGMAPMYALMAAFHVAPWFSKGPG